MNLASFLIFNLIVFTLFLFLPNIIFGGTVNELIFNESFLIMLFPIIVFSSFLTKVRHAHIYLGMVSRVLLSWLVGVAFSISNLFFLNILDDSIKGLQMIILISSYFVIYLFFISIIFYSFRNKRSYDNLSGLQKNILILGKDKTSEKIYRKLSLQKQLVVKKYDDYIDSTKAISFIEENNIDTVFISFSKTELKYLTNLTDLYLQTSSNIIWLPPEFLRNSLDIEYSNFMGFSGIHMNATPLHFKEALFFKRLMDIVVSLLGILITLPVMMVIAIVIKLSSAGPILFKQRRNGLNGREFKILKFRSMHMHESNKVVQATKNDSRVTRIGKFIRKTSIDELPQLFNVLWGDMSLIGPRPHAKEHNEYYGSQIHSYISRHRIKPGITGLAQINGYRGETETIDKMKKRVAYDLKYIRNWSLFLDFKILILTIPALLMHKGQ